jgi:hypothetical protein
VLERSCGLFTWLLRNIWRFGVQTYFRTPAFHVKAKPTTSLSSSRSLERAVILNCGEMLVRRMSTCAPRNQRSVRAWYNCSSLLPSRSPQRISILLTKPQSRCKARFSIATSVLVDLYDDCNSKCKIFTFNIMDVAQFTKCGK